jgi:hypothetical protein
MSKCEAFSVSTSNKILETLHTFCSDMGSLFGVVAGEMSRVLRWQSTPLPEDQPAIGSGGFANLSHTEGEGGRRVVADAAGSMPAYNFSGDDEQPPETTKPPEESVEVMGLAAEGAKSTSNDDGNNEKEKSTDSDAAVEEF